MIQTRQRIDDRSGKAAIIRRTSMSYDRLMQVAAEQAMQRAMAQINRRMSLTFQRCYAEPERPFQAAPAQRASCTSEEAIASQIAA
jgi:hypothetical protein